MRTYNETHPWITFRVDLRSLDYRLWLLLGEAKSKCQHISGVPLLPATAEQLHQIYLAKGVLATTAIEGNTLTENEVRQRIEGKLKLPPSKEYLGQEIDNIIVACNEIGNYVFPGTSTHLTVEAIKHYNQLVLKNLPLDSDVMPGEVRAYNVGVGRYRGVPSEDCEFLLEKLVDWLNEEFKPPEAGYRLIFGLLKAIIAHLYLAWIHPFGDGNGRTARLVELQILLASGVPTAAAHLLSNFYNQTRSEYYRQLDLASRSGGDVIPFIHYAVQGFVDGLKEQLDYIQQQQLYVHWVNYVHDRFRDKDSTTETRRRRFVLDLTARRSPVPFSEIRHISPRIAEAFAGKTDKTIQRDLRALEEMNLIQRTNQGIRAKTEIIQAFLPGTRLEE